MISPRFAAAALACTLALGGCAARVPADSGARVRAIMASQVVTPQPARPNAGHTDAAAAVAAYANYQRSYVTPTPQADSPTFGK